MTDNIIRKGGTGKDRTQFGVHDYSEALVSLAPDQKVLTPEQNLAIWRITDGRKLHEIASSSHSPAVHLEVAKNRYATARTINHISQASDSDVVHFAVLLRRELDGNEVNRLAHSESPQVRRLARARAEFKPNGLRENLAYAFDGFVNGRLQTA